MTWLRLESGVAGLRSAAAPLKNEDPAHSKKFSPGVSWQAHWHRSAPEIEVRLPGCRPQQAVNGVAEVALARKPGTDA